MGSSTPGRVHSELDNVVNTSISSITVLSTFSPGHYGHKEPNDR
jgi:hypothetical protein